MSIAISQHSRFQDSTAIVADGVETFGLMTKPFFLDPKNLDPDTQIISITITPDLAGRPWAIANKIYNSPVLDWVVVLFNKPLNPVSWPANGSVIKLPVPSVVLANA